MLYNAGDVLFVSRSRRMLFRLPVKTVSTHLIDEVLPCLKIVAAGVARGFYAAGFLAYEAASAFDPALKVHSSADLPILWFGLYKGAEDAGRFPVASGIFNVGGFSPLISQEEYTENIRKIRHLIAAGETYQVNYTFPLQATFHGNSLSWFQQLCAAQQADYCAWVNLGNLHILSASPELFFRLKSHKLETKPMKGTRKRGRWSEEDLKIAASLIDSEKDRAENVMIVDLLRNDMSRISEPGSVNVDKLFNIEQYPTVWQMTSTITSRTRSSVPEIIKALFPCGSITGAPKVRTMEIIRDIEPFPRGIYCGTIGWWAPTGEAEFNVAIRTVTVDIKNKKACYNVGGGITYSSVAEEEYNECLMKASVLNRYEPQFDLIETIFFDNDFFLLPMHMERLERSARYFGFKVGRASVEAALAKQVIKQVKTRKKEAVAIDKSNAADQSFAIGPSQPRISQLPALMVRLLLHRDGSFQIGAQEAKYKSVLRLGFAAEPVDENDVFLYHKTTNRTVYKHALTSRPECDDVLLWNRRGEITESTIANLVLDIHGKLLTPPVSSGLLAGTFRRYLLEHNKIQEATLTRDDIARARSIYLINSVRKWIKVKWMDLNC